MESKPSDDIVLIIAKKRFKTLCSEEVKSFETEALRFGHQVAGHTREVILSCNGKILKPMLKEQLFRKEVTFYEEMYQNGTSCSQTNCAFIPQYFGVYRSTSDTDYLVLEDMTRFYHFPNIIDLKIGKQTFEPTAPLEKKQRGILKCPYQEIIGFRISGYKYFNSLENRYVIVDKNFGRNLEPQSIKPALAIFFCNGALVRVDVIFVVIQKLQTILRWMKRQTKYHFYCSSLLIIYEGMMSSSLSSSPSSSPVKFDDVLVKMIDFAHTVNGNGTLDEGYTYGLEKLIYYLSDILYATEKSINSL